MFVPGRYEEDAAALRALRMVLRDLTYKLLGNKKWEWFWEPEEDPEWWDKVGGGCVVSWDLLDGCWTRWRVRLAGRTLSDGARWVQGAMSGYEVLLALLGPLLHIAQRMHCSTRLRPSTHPCVAHNPAHTSPASHPYASPGHSPHGLGHCAGQCECPRVCHAAAVPG